MMRYINLRHNSYVNDGTIVKSIDETWSMDLSDKNDYDLEKKRL